MKKFLFPILCVLIISILFQVPAYADMGPKPSVSVSFENLDEGPCYATLLAKSDSTGPYSVHGGQKEHIIAASGISEDIWRAFAGYDDTDGYYFLWTVWKVDVSKKLTWGYYPPDTFKILLYYPDTGRFAVSGVCERYAFDSYFTADASGGGSYDMTVRKSYLWLPEVISLVVRIIVTIAVEILIALLFGFKSREELMFIAIVNIVTQVILNVLLNIINFRSGLLAFFIYYVLLEFVVFTIEAVVYSVFLRKRSVKAKPVLIYPLYALVANAVSFGAGAFIACFVPGIV